MKVTPEVRKELCPICQSELVDIRYTGSNREQFSGKTEVFADFVENGVVVWVEKLRKRRKGIALAKNKITESESWNFRESFVDDVFPSQFPVCFYCGEIVSSIDHLGNVGGRPVHIHCKEKLENGRKEVAC